MNIKHAPEDSRWNPWVAANKRRTLDSNEGVSASGIWAPPMVSSAAVASGWIKWVKFHGAGKGGCSITSSKRAFTCAKKPRTGCAASWHAAASSTFVGSVWKAGAIFTDTLKGRASASVRWTNNASPVCSPLWRPRKFAAACGNSHASWKIECCPMWNTPSSWIFSTTSEQDSWRKSWIHCDPSPEPSDFLVWQYITKLPQIESKVAKDANSLEVTSLLPHELCASPSWTRPQTHAARRTTRSRYTLRKYTLSAATHEDSKCRAANLPYVTTPLGRPKMPAVQASNVKLRFCSRGGPHSDSRSTASVNRSHLSSQTSLFFTPRRHTFLPTDRLKREAW